MGPSERIKELAEHFTKRSFYWEMIYSKKNNPPNFMIYELDSRMRNALSLLEHFSNNKTLKILDVGCGTGHYIEQLLMRKHNVFGNDVAIGMLIKSQNKYYRFRQTHKLSLSNIEKLPFQNSSFDAVLCIGVIEYLPDIYKALRELNRIVKEDGIVIISAPNLLSIKFLTDPYYLKRGIKYLLHKIGLSKLNSGQTLNDVSMNHDFKNKRFRFHKLVNIFYENGFIVTAYKNVSFGPLSFFLKPIFSLRNNIRFSKWLENISNKKVGSLLKKFANRWVFELRKNH